MFFLGETVSIPFLSAVGMVRDVVVDTRKEPKGFMIRLDERLDTGERIIYADPSELKKITRH